MIKMSKSKSLQPNSQKPQPKLEANPRRPDTFQKLYSRKQNFKSSLL